MKKNILLYPKFLQRFDSYLVKKYPLIWSIRAHYFLYYSMLSCILLGALAVITPIGMGDLGYSSNSTSISISSILAVTVACFWVYKTVIFDKQRQFGNRKITDEYISFILSFITLTGIWFIIFSYAGVLEAKRRNVVSNSEFIEDINTANLAQVFMVSTDNRNSSVDSYQPNFQPEIKAGSPIINNNFEYFTNYNLYKVTYKEKYKAPDDGLEPEYKYVEGLDRSKAIYAKALDVKTKAQVYELLKKLADLSQKYDIYNNDDNYNHYNSISFEDLKRHYDVTINSNEPAEVIDSAKMESQNNYTEVDHTPMWMEADNFKSLMSSRFTRIAGYKYGRHGFFDTEFLLVSFYFLLGICILLHIFKNVRWRQFVILVVVGCLLPIVYAIIGAIIVPGGSGVDSYIKICYYGTFFYGLVHVILAFENKEYSLWNIIGVMIFNVMVLTIPIFTFLIVTEHHSHDYENYTEMLYTIQVIETVFFVVVMLPMLKRIYERIFSLPRN